MPFGISTQARNNYLYITANGKVTRESILDLATVIRRECDDHQLQAALLDCAGMVGALSVTELFIVAQEFVRIVGVAIKVAYINPPKEWAPEDDQFIRTVAQNRGGFLEVFDTEEEAVAWFNQ